MDDTSKNATKRSLSYFLPEAEATAKVLRVDCFTEKNPTFTTTHTVGEPTIHCSTTQWIHGLFE